MDTPAPIPQTAKEEPKAVEPPVNPFILKLDSDLQPTTAIGPEKDDAGQVIHYRKVKIAQCGKWTHRGSGEPIDISHQRADQWVANSAALSAAGVKPFIPGQHKFSGFDAKENHGYVLNVNRENDDVYATIALYGDEALKTAAKNSRSIGIIADGRDASGKVYPGETLHHLALVPNPALPDLGGMMKIAASADVPTYEISKPVHVEPAPIPLPGIKPKDVQMTPEIAQRVRRALSLAVDVTDEKLADVVAEKAMSLSADVAKLSAERDAAIADSTAKGQTVLALSAELPKKPDANVRSMYESNWLLLRNHIIGKGIVTEPQMKAGEQIFQDRDGGIGTLALSASGLSDRKEVLFAFGQWVLSLDGSGVKFSAGTIRDPDFKVLGRAGDGISDERYRELGMDVPARRA